MPGTSSRAARCGRPYSGQTGFALFAAVIFLTVLTILGLGAMRMSVVAERMASSHQHRNIAFHIAETGLALAFSSVEHTLAPPAEAPGTHGPTRRYEVVDGAPIPCDLGGAYCSADTTHPVLETRTWYVAEGAVLPPGYSLDGSFTAHHFSTSSEARHGSIQVRLSQGYRRIGPGSAQ